MQKKRKKKILFSSRITVQNNHEIKERSKGEKHQIKYLSGWARSHEGKVFVENRVCTRAMNVSNSGFCIKKSYSLMFKF